MAQRRLIIREPDDFHAHLRDGSVLCTVLPYTARHFRRAIVMPNLKDSIKTVLEAAAYKGRIDDAQASEMKKLIPLMTLFITEDTPVEEIIRAVESGFVYAVKVYPANATTNSTEGVRSLKNIRPQLAVLEKYQLPFLMHGELTHDSLNQSIDHFDREARFIDSELPWLQDTFPHLRMVLEHITTAAAAQYLLEHGGQTLAATITPHHLVLDRRALFEGGLNPHMYCLPVLKRSEDRDALRALATSGTSYVFAGTDTAPHPTDAKERACGCAAGCFVAPVALSMYAEVFEEEGALDKLEAFLSENGADWYGLPRNQGMIMLVREDEPWAPEQLLLSPKYTETERRVLSSRAMDLDSIRPFGMHDDPAKSLKWHWRVED